jgi:hypothetical protein
MVTRLKVAVFAVLVDRQNCEVNMYRVGTGCAMDFRGLFSLVQLLTVRWQCWLLPH